MSRKHRRIKPTSRSGRKRVAELNGILGNARTSRAERAAALAELDKIAPFDGTPSESTPPSEETSSEKECLPEGSSVPPPAPATDDPLSQIDWRTWIIPELHSAPPLDQRCILLLADFQVRTGSARECFANEERMLDCYLEPIFTLCDLDYIETAFIQRCGEVPEDEILRPRSECRDSKFGVLKRKATEFYRSRPAAEQKRLHDAYEKVKHCCRPGGEVHALYERMRDAMLREEYSEPKASLGEDKHGSPNLLPAVEVSPEEPVNSTRRDPIERAGVDLHSRAVMLLNSDPFLARLAEWKNGELREQIIAEIMAKQLDGGGAGDAVFLAEIYEQHRPLGMSQFLPRRF